jgi:hypothetical protein
MMTPAHCDKSPLKEITLRTKEKQLLQGHFSQMHKATHFVVLGHICFMNLYDQIILEYCACLN